jgi:hypothetical protein
MYGPGVVQTAGKETDVPVVQRVFSGNQLIHPFFQLLRLAINSAGSKTAFSFLEIRAVSISLAWPLSFYNTLSKHVAFSSCAGVCISEIS